MLLTAATAQSIWAICISLGLAIVSCAHPPTLHTLCIPTHTSHRANTLAREPLQLSSPLWLQHNSEPLGDPHLKRWGFLTPPVEGADLRAALDASCLRGACQQSVDVRIHIPATNEDMKTTTAHTHAAGPSKPLAAEHQIGR